MKPGRVVLLVLGCLFAVLGVGLLIGSGSLSWAIATQRDSDGFFTTSSHSQQGAAVTSDHLCAHEVTQRWSIE